RRHTRSKRDWSSDVCSSDLDIGGALALAAVQKGNKANVCSYAMKLATPNWFGGDPVIAYAILNDCVLQKGASEEEVKAFEALEKIGRASCRERVYVVYDIVV